MDVKSLKDNRSSVVAAKVVENILKELETSVLFRNETTYYYDLASLRSVYVESMGHSIKAVRTKVRDTLVEMGLGCMHQKEDDKLRVYYKKPAKAGDEVETDEPVECNP